MARQKIERVQLMWWGYKHSTGGVQVKRFFDNRQINEAIESDNVLFAIGPFPAYGRADATKQFITIEKSLDGSN